jgi:hypothetical protein
VKIEGEAIFMDGYLLIAAIKNHSIFDYIGLIHNDQDQLTEYSYYSHSREKTQLNRESILSGIEKYYGVRSMPDSTENGIIWRFRKGDDFASFLIKTDGCELTLSTHSLIKAVHRFDKGRKANTISVSGLVTNHWEDYASGRELGEYHVFFEGLKEKKVIMMYLSSTKKDSRTLKLVLDDSITISVRTASRSKFRYGNYANEIELPQSIADRLNESSEVKILTTGNLKDEIEMPPRILKIFKVIYHEMYN